MINNKNLDYLVSTLNEENSYYNNFLDKLQTNNKFTQQIHINNVQSINIVYNLDLNYILNNISKKNNIKSLENIKVVKKQKSLENIEVVQNNNLDLNAEHPINVNILKKDILYKFIDNKELSPFNTFQTIKLISVEPILVGVCIIIYDKFLSLNDDKQLKFIKELKFKMAFDLDKKDLYEKFNYRQIRFKKSNFQELLIENKKIDTNHFYKYLGDYFNLNLLIVGKNVEFMNNYSKDRYSIVIFKNNNDEIYIQYNLEGNSLINDLYIKTLNIGIIKENDTFYKNKKLNELQNIASKLNIEILKQGKNGLKKKTKKELIEEINESK